MKGKMKRASGGATPGKDVYEGADSNVVKEAMARKKGGPVKSKAECGPDGKKSAMRLDRPGRKMGGRVGADSSPLSSAASTESRSDTRQTDI